ncbi:MAG: XRE family transcriptional regulator [Desulfobacterales bacterium]|jgi:transcriptional regulator with XRE-family HTH domain|nr:XRE family transcriptional regulator [Desulfobacterales bacterium]
MENKDEFARQIGNRLKELRKEACLTLKQLAKATELSAPLISKIENGLAMPSVPSLRVIADALKVNTGYFFRDEEEREYVISRHGSRRKIDSKKGYIVELVADGMDNPFMEPAIVTLAKKGQKEEIELAVHDGQEFMYVLEGRIELFLGKKTYILKKGDAGYWNGSIPHMGISLSKKAARTLNVHFVPGKRTGTF